MAYVSRLTNGTSYNLAGIDATSNSTYFQDPYFNFQLPCNAINLRVTLVDDAQQSLYTNAGWLLVQRGQQPSSNSDTTDIAITYTDGRLATGALGGGYQVPAAEHLFALTIPSNQNVAGEWFVSLDFNAVMHGGTLLVQWDYGNTAPQTLTNLVMNTSSATSLTNGVLNDGADFFFTLPASPPANGEGIAYWTTHVPYNYTLTVILNDNRAGDLQASIRAGTHYYALGLSLNGDLFSQSPTRIGGAPCDLGAAFLNTPMAVSYTSQVVGGETVYINVSSTSSVPVQGLRMLMNCVPGTQWLPNSDYGLEASTPSSNPGSSGWINDYTTLNAIAGFGPTLATQTDMLTAFTVPEGNYPGTYLSHYPSDPTSLAENQGGDAIASFVCNDSTVTKSFNNDVNGLAGTVYTRLGFYPGTQLITGTDWDSSGLERSSFVQPAPSVFLYLYEMISSPWSRVNTTTPATWDNATLTSQLAVCLPWDGRMDGTNRPLRPGSASTYISSAIMLELYSAAGDGSLGTLLHQVIWNAMGVPYANASQGAIVVEYGQFLTVDSGGNVLAGSGSIDTQNALLNAITALGGGASFTGATLIAPAGWFKNVPTFLIDANAADAVLISSSRYYVKATVISVA